ncbi:hypothetical protein HVA01_09020 [Halovibrio variabilis]|uniref:Uncharacterized protein n=1 Tax=Halovibrio variabilis TaxID=31910 RepID=A0A511UKY8_9GAMM|nr:hypothetical protein HVA01_09020 [Halovibrio variabilis]
MAYAPDVSPSQPQQDPLNSMAFYGSAIAIGVHKGIRRLSELDMLLALLLSSLTFILRDPITTPPVWKRILWAAISGVLTRQGGPHRQREGTPNGRCLHRKRSLPLRKADQETLVKITITEIVYHETLRPRGHGSCRYRHADVPACLGAAG